jgi:KUP system potassium uptake protein
MVGVLVLLFVFQSSHNLASAYGIAVTGAMLIDTLLAYPSSAACGSGRCGRRGPAADPVRRIDTVFLTSNLLKIPDGAWLPLVLGAVLVLIMWTWTRGSANPDRQGQEATACP